MKEIILKFRSVIMLLLCVCMSASLLSSCSDDDEENNGGNNGLIGYWVNQNDPNGEWVEVIEWCVDQGKSSPHEGVGIYYQFVDDNTVFWGSIDAYDSYRSDAFTTVYAYGNPYYLVINPGEITYTYVLTDNKVYFSNGVIYTIMNGKLYMEGSGQIYTKIM